MSYRRDLKRLRRARQQLKRQRHALVALELEGIVTLTLHSVARSLTLAIQAETRDDLVDLLLEAISQRRLILQAEAVRAREDWQQALDRRQRPSAPDEPSDSSPAR
jgi:hypothetical protein